MASLAVVTSCRRNPRTLRRTLFNAYRVIRILVDDTRDFYRSWDDDVISCTTSQIRCLYALMYTRSVDAAESATALFQNNAVCWNILHRSPSEFRHGGN